jgi:hypothetical protein
METGRSSVVTARVTLRMGAPRQDFQTLSCFLDPGLQRLIRALPQPDSDFVVFPGTTLVADALKDTRKFQVNRRPVNQFLR